MRNLFFLLLLCCSTVIFAQNSGDSNAIDVDIFKGNVLPHAPDMQHLVTGHPEGFMVSFSKRTHGSQEWQTLYNYPDYGSYILFQDFKNEILGKNYAVGAFYNFYFLIIRYVKSIFSNRVIC